MNKTGPIVIIEDDEDDQEVLTEIFGKLDCINEVVFFQNGNDALHYLADPLINPFIILSDINMPVLSGFEMRKLVFNDADLSAKCIPYLFFTTAASKDFVRKAYALSVQGFFVKPTRFEELEETIKSIIDYWQKCYSPSRFETNDA